MQKRTLMRGISLLLGLSFLGVGFPETVKSAQVPLPSSGTCNYYAGRSSENDPVNVDLCSISRVGDRVNFTYFLETQNGNMRIDSQADCRGGFWITFPENEQHRPRSQATQNMIERVCRPIAQVPTNTRTQQAEIILIPSQIQVSPSGETICTINRSTTIAVYNLQGEWFSTNTCGQTGVIHRSRLRIKTQ